MFKKAPLAVFVYNRPSHTKRLIESLAQNSSAKDSEIFIFSDNAKNHSEIRKVTEVRAYIESLEVAASFSVVHILKAETNLGLAKSVIKGVTQLLEKYGKVIVLEDDLLTTPYFIDYMNDALDFYEVNNKIWSISGYCPPIKIPENYKQDIFFTQRGCSWGWATWIDRWLKIDWNVCDYSEFKKQTKLREKFSAIGRDLPYMLDMQMHNKIDSWAIRWVYAQFKLNAYTVYPIQSMISNLGTDGSGTHTTFASKKFHATLLNCQPVIRFCDVIPDRTITNAFRDFYLSYLGSLMLIPKEKLKWVLKFLKTSYSSSSPRMVFKK